MKELQKLTSYFLLLAAVCQVILGLTFLFTPAVKISSLTTYLVWTLVLAGLAELFTLPERPAGLFILASGLAKALAPAWFWAGNLLENWLAVLVLLAASLQLLAANRQKKAPNGQLIWPAGLAVLVAIPLTLGLLSGQLAVFCGGLLLIAIGLADLLLFFQYRGPAGEDWRMTDG